MRKRTLETTPRADAKVPQDIVNDLIGAIRGQFYADRDEKRWWVERPILLKAVTYPAWLLAQRGGTGLPWPQYQGILFGIMQTIKRHGDSERARNFGRYFLTAVQSHMQHHWEEYLTAAKRASHALDAVMLGLKPSAAPVAGDSTVTDLARLHSAVSPKGGRRPKTARGGPSQPSLF